MMLTLVSILMSSCPNSYCEYSVPETVLDIGSNKALCMYSAQQITKLFTHKPKGEVYLLSIAM